MPDIEREDAKKEQATAFKELLEKMPIDDAIKAAVKDEIISPKTGRAFAKLDRDLSNLVTEILEEKNDIVPKDIEFLKTKEDAKNERCEGISSSKSTAERLKSLHVKKIKDARKVLRESFKDDGMKLGYMANMRMFINDRTDVLIDEQVIYDMIDYIFHE